MNRLVSHRAFALGFWLCASLLWLRAAEAQSLLVSPVVINAQAQKSGDKLPPVKVTNSGAEEVEVSIRLAPLSHDIHGGPLEAPTNYKYSGKDLFVVKPDKFKLGPGQSRNVVVQVNVPKNRTGGAYAIMYVIGDSAKKKKLSVGASAGVGVLVEVALPGPVKRGTKASKVYATQDKPNGPIDLFVIVRNNGNVHEKLVGSFTVSDPKSKKELAKVPIMPGNVFPEATRHMRGTWKNPPKLAPGKYAITAQVGPQGSAGETVVGQLEIVKPGVAASPKAVVTKFATPPTVQKRPLALEAAILNQGNVPLTAVGKLTFTDEAGKEIAVVALTGKEAIAPGAKGTLTGTLPNGLPPGRFIATLDVSTAIGAPLARFTSIQQVIEKEVILAAKIAKFTAPSAKEPFFTVEFLNEGNAEVDAEGVVLVRDSSGNVVGQVVLEKQRVKPGATASYKRALPKDLEPGLYELVANVTYGGKSPASAQAKHFVQ